MKKSGLGDKMVIEVDWKRFQIRGKNNSRLFFRLWFPPWMEKLLSSADENVGIR